MLFDFYRDKVWMSVTLGTETGTVLVDFYTKEMRVRQDSEQQQ